MKRGSDIYPKSNYAVFHIQEFCISGCDNNEVYKVLSVEKKWLKVVNNAIDGIGLWWLMIVNFPKFLRRNQPTDTHDRLD